MSMHKIPLTQLEEDGLRAHGLDIGSPSQLSDVFRQGIRWALEQTAPQPERWHSACGDWRETNLAIHGERSGYIACGIPEAKARAIINAHNAGLPGECAALTAQGGE